MNWKTLKSGLVAVVVYLLIFLAILLAIFIATLSQAAPLWISENVLAIRCGLSSGMGGSLYLLRAVYLRCCVHDDWTDVWMPWYFIRPVVSVLCGFVAFIFLSAGLIVLDASKIEGSAEYGFYALALLAGLNVDRFVVRIEEIGKAIFGIEKSRSAQNSQKDD